MSPVQRVVDREADPSFRETRAKIDAQLSVSSPVEWEVVNCLLQSLSGYPIHSPETRFSSTHDDPMGRLLLARILSRNPPPVVLEAALSIFPDALRHNPAAFFTACRNATPDIIAHMIRHCTRHFDDNQDECPYPWIVSEFISVEGAKALLQAFPKGVLKSSSLLSSFNLVDFFLISPDMVEQRTFNADLWNKFKLMLVAAEYSEKKGCRCGCHERRERKSGGCACREISPVQVILDRINSYPDFWGTPERTRHVLWLLHQLRWTDHWVFEKRSADGRYPLHHVLSHKCTTNPSGLPAARELIKLLVEAHPASASHSFEGRLPLHMALENGWPCHDLLLAAYPDALDSQDVESELYPFQAAAHQVSSSPMALDVTFELLRANPNHASTLGAHAY